MSNPYLKPLSMDSGGFRSHLNLESTTIMNILCPLLPGQPSPVATLTSHSPSCAMCLFLCLCYALCLVCLLVLALLLDNSYSLGINLGAFSGKLSLTPLVLFDFSPVCSHGILCISFSIYLSL